MEAQQREIEVGVRVYPKCIDLNRRSVLQRKRHARTPSKSKASKSIESL